MTRQQVNRSHPQSHSDTPLVSGILQRAAVRNIQELDVQPTKEVDDETFRESGFVRNFSQMPVSTEEIPRVQPKRMKRSPLNSPHQWSALPIQEKLTIGQERERVLQGKGGETEANPATAEVQRPNYTGLPDRLKLGIETLSGLSMDGVRVHYNSVNPAKVKALAYTKGTDIHIAPGQEKHLQHEAWHVVQQGQGRVQQTMQMKNGVRVNDNQGLEQEADVMGAKATSISKIAVQEQKIQEKASLDEAHPQQQISEQERKSSLNSLYSPPSSAVIQRKNRIDSYKATDELHPLSVLEESFGKQKTDQQYSIMAGGGAISLSQFYGGKQKLSRPTQVIAKLDGPLRAIGMRSSDPLQSAMGNIGDHERAILGRSSSKSYEGGHLISDKILGASSYEEYNFAPQLADVNAPVYRHVEELAEKGLIDKNTLKPVHGVEITMQVDLTYAEDKYKVAVADLSRHGVIPNSFTATDTGGTDIDFPRRVPWKWENTLSFDVTQNPQAVFSQKNVGTVAHRSFVGPLVTVNPTLRRMGSQEHLWGMDSGVQDSNTRIYKVGGGVTEKFLAYQATPEPIAMQKAYNPGGNPPPVRVVPLVTPPTKFSAPVKVSELHDETSPSYMRMMTDLTAVGMQDLPKQIANMMRRRIGLNKGAKATQKQWASDLRTRLKGKNKKNFATTNLTNDSNLDFS